MICPGSLQECNNPACRYGGCQGRSTSAAVLSARSALYVNGGARERAKAEVGKLRKAKARGKLYAKVGRGLRRRDRAAAMTDSRSPKDRT